MQLLDEFSALVEKITQVPAHDVEPHKSLVDDLGVDSLDLVELVEAVQARWGVSVSHSEYVTLRTVQDVLDRIALTQHSEG